MAYRQPAFMFDSALAAQPIAEVTARNATALTAASQRALIDRRAGPFALITATGANAGAEFDLQTTTLKGFTRGVIPRGHNLAGETVRVISDTTPGMATPTVHATLVGPSDASAMDFAFAAGSTERYWGFEVTTSSAENFLVGEFALGVFSQLTADAWVQPSFAREYVHGLTDDTFGGRLATVELAPARHRFSLEVLNVTAGSADDLLLDQVIRDGRTAPFWYWPPDDAAAIDGPYLVQLTSSPQRRQESRAPQSTGPRYSVRLEMVEQLT